MLGIYGSGQLSRLLAEAAKKMGVEVAVFGDAKTDPAAQIAPQFFSRAELPQFLKSIDTLVFENEFFDKKELTQALPPTVRCVPSLQVMGKLRDKSTQKQILKELQIPTANFEIFDPKTGFIQIWLRELQPPKVLKWSLHGYDGKGNFFYKDVKELPALRKFCEDGVAKSRDLKIYVEDMIDFEAEMAMVACRSSSGEFVNLPLVFSRQENGICREVWGPASEFGVNSKLEEQAASTMKRFADHLGLEGCFAFEFFLTKDKTLLVNEIAPRVHNSAHYSEHAAQPSQFELHILTALGKPLPQPKTQKVFGMRNLLGPQAGSHSKLSSPEKIHLSWYGKNETRPGRKMGHLNYFSQNLSEFQNLKSQAEKFELEFWGGQK